MNSAFKEKVWLCESERHCWKGENAGYQHFLPLQQYFTRPSTVGAFLTLALPALRNKTFHKLKIFILIFRNKIFLSNTIKVAFTIDDIYS